MGVDNHSPPGGLPTAGPADSYTATQHYGYRDFRSDPAAVDGTLGWQVQLLGPIPIVRRVYLDAATGNWFFEATKAGVTATAILP